MLIRSTFNSNLHQYLFDCSKCGDSWGWWFRLHCFHCHFGSIRFIVNQWSIGDDSNRLNTLRYKPLHLAHDPKFSFNPRWSKLVNQIFSIQGDGSEVWKRSCLALSHSRPAFGGHDVLPRLCGRAFWQVALHSDGFWKLLLPFAKYHRMYVSAYQPMHTTNNRAFIAYCILYV